MAVVLALLVLVGFSRNFYLRSLFVEARYLTPIVYVHGFLFTGWMILLLVQTTLVAAGKVRLHRLIGVSGAFLASLMVIIGSLSQIEHTQRMIADGSYYQNHFRENFLFIVALLAMVVFGILVGIAVYRRRSPDTHKRLMICATIVLAFAAVNRIVALIFGESVVGPIGGLVITDLLLVPLLVYDLATRQRLHRATVWGSLAVLSLLGVASSPIVLSEPMDELIHWVAGR
jgi:hypothetical protein